MTLTDEQLIAFNKNFKEMLHMVSLFFSKMIDENTEIIDIKLEKIKNEWNHSVAYTVVKKEKKYEISF